MAYLAGDVEKRQARATGRTGLFSRGLISHVPKREVVFFARELSTMISSNVPIVRSLRILAKQINHKSFRYIINHIADGVDSGSKLSVALAQFPGAFDNFFVYMVRAGETTGRLDEVLTYLANQKEKDYELNGKIISALIYPSIIFIGMVGVFVLMMVRVIPNMLSLVQQTGAHLPWTTRALIGFSHFFTAAWPFVLGVLILGVVGLLLSRRNPASRLLLDQFRLRLPLFGPLYQKIYMVRFSRSLSNLLQSGVPINKSLEIVADIVSNSMYKKIILNASTDVEAGRTMSSSLSASPLVPQMVVQMIGVGEETGRIDVLLSKVSDFYAKEVERTTTNLVTFIEPVVIITLGIGVLILVSGVLLPIYDIAGQF